MKKIIAIVLSFIFVFCAWAPIASAAGKLCEAVIKENRLQVQYLVECGANVNALGGSRLRSGSKEIARNRSGKTSSRLVGNFYNIL